MQPVSLLGLIGSTPLIELVRLSPHPGVRIFAKLEGSNPSGSVKDRIVLAMVRAAEDRGDLRQGDAIVEASSGNTAIALATVARQRGYEAKVVIPNEVAPSIGSLLELYGVEVSWCESRAGMKEAIDLARTTAEREGAYYLGQFDNPVNVDAHYETTGREIAEALGRVDLFVAGIGTGGTIMGAGRRLREVNPDVRLIGVEPRAGERLQGLRSLSEGYVAPLLDLSLLNGRFLVDNATAIATAYRVARLEGILAGVSSGATLHVALRLARDMTEGNIVVMFSDGAWKYLPAQPWDAALAGSPELDEIHWW